MTQYAIIKTGSKQYRVAAGDIIDVELLGTEKNGKVSFNEVLFFSDGSTHKAGASQLSKAIVHGEVVGEVRAPKVIAYKYKKRKRSTRHKIGHRQHYTRVKITELAI